MIADVLLSLFNVRLLFIVSIICLISSKPMETRKQTMGLERLIDRIFTANSYNPLVRPVDKYGMTNVFTELKLLQIDLDEKYQELVSTVWIEMSWEDERLSWNESDFDNIKEITLPVSKLWVPDIVLQNGVGRNEYLNEMKYFNPWISNTGLITWVPEIRLHSRCMIKVSDFPFDTQCCEINFYSWAHTINQMKIQQYGDKNITNLTHLSFNTEWQVYHTCALHKIIVTSEELHWWVTSYVIYIKRHTAYHIYNLLMPCFVLSMLSMLLFLLPPDSGEKVTLGVTILLAFFVNSLVVSNYTPEAASDLPVIAVYYIFNICLVSVSMGTSVCVLNFHFRGHKVTPVPIWLKYALIIRDDRIYNRCSKNDKLNGVSVYGENTSKQNGGKDMNGEAIVVRDSVSNSCHQRHYHQKSSSATKLKLCSSPSMPPSSTSTHLLAKQTTHTILIPASASPSPSPRCRHHHSHNHQQSSSRSNHKPFNQMKTFDLVYCSDDEERINDVPHVRSNGGVTTSNESGTTTSTSVSSSNASGSSEWSLMRENLSKIQKLLKRSVFILERSRLRERSIAVLNDEWKEVASRIDLVLFLVASTIVIFTPIGLFGKFFIRDDFFRNMNHTCGCENIH